MNPPTPLFPTATRFLQWLPRSRARRRGLVALVTLIAVAAVGYLVEDWRGKRAWEKCKHELAARGVVLDWAANVPPPVPDAQNIFKAPNMRKWFIGRGQNQFSRRLAMTTLDDFVKARHPNREPAVVAKVEVIPLNAPIPTDNASLVLRYDHGVLTGLESLPAPATGEADPGTPDIQIDNAPLPDVITALARQAQMNIMFDPQIEFLRPGADGRPVPVPSVSLHWKSVTARNALLAVLDIYELELHDDPATRIARISGKNRSSPRQPADPAARAQLGGLVQKAIGPYATASEIPSLVFRPAAEIVPVRVFIRSDKILPAKQVAELFPVLSPDSNGAPGGDFTAEPDGTNSFRVVPGTPPCSAADYLAWSDQFAGDFAMLREALKRPHARMPGDYDMPFEMPIPNFIAIRTSSQMLSDRARCYLLLGQPEAALADLTLIRDLCRMLEAKPSGRPMTLVAAMINVAVTGLYTSVIHDGLQWDAWREPQLIALGKQLAQINLPPLVEAGLAFEPVAVCRTFEATAPIDLANFFEPGATTNTVVQRLKSGALLWAIAPRGWIYQNMAVYATLETKNLGALDISRNLIHPRAAEDAMSAVNDTVRHRTPYNFLAGVAIPNVSRACQTCGKNQTLANEALLACALKRYYLAHGELPDKLDALVPQFAGKIPTDLIGGEPLRYRRSGPGQFLLYSIGWNETDDGGVDSGDAKSGDWVWASR